MKILGFGSGLFWLIAAISGISQQAVLAWAAVISAIILGALPTYTRLMDTIHSAEARARELRRPECEEQLKRQRIINDDLTRRINTLERELTEWQRLYDAGASGSGDFKKLG